MSQKLLDLLKAEFGSAVIETHSEHGDDTAVVETSAWLEVSKFLRDDPRCDMQMMIMNKSSWYGLGHSIAAIGTESVTCSPLSKKPA